MNDTESRDAILKNINGALKSKKLYPAGHPAITAPINKLCGFIEDALKARNNIAVGLVNDALVFEDDLIVEGEKLYPDVIHYMKEKNVSAVIFERGFSVKELTGFIDILSGVPVITGPVLQKELSAQGITHITLKSVPEGKKNILEIYNGAVEVVKSVMGEVRMGKIPKSEPVNEIIGELTESVFSDQNAIIGLTMIKNYDNYLYNHSVNVSIISLSLGRAMKLSEEELHAVGVAALLHDVGKTGVSENIIRKPGGLSSEEWEKIKEHPLLGSNITKRMEGMDETIGRLIYEHHIKYDHSGYPQTTSSLHPLSQIITISDAYDALTTLRVYQQPHNPVEAVKVMSNFSGRHFNPEILKAFINMIGLYPVGTVVRLTTNEIGIVVKVDSEAGDCPLVKIIYGKDGSELDPPYKLDLRANTEVSIVSTVNPVAANIDLSAFFEKESTD